MSKIIREITINSSSQMEKVASELATLFVPGDCIALHGELGAGKTTFVRGFTEGCGIDEANAALVNSPTFSLMNQYSTSKGTIYHFDLYRLETLAQFEDLDFIDYLESKSAICFVEWASRIEGLKSSFTYEITIELLSKTKRKLILSKKTS